MLTKEQLAEIEERAVKALKCRCDYEYCASCSTTYINIIEASKDIITLTNHIEELTQKAFCKHDWTFLWRDGGGGFKCSKCQKIKDKL